jgi:hypothetical protein
MSVFGIREQILQNNPFFSGIAADPWDNTDPDVPSLNREAYRHLCELILAKSRNPRAALAGLILGETGMGKTHLLKRLLRYIRKNGIETIFVSVHPLSDAGKPMRHLLREIAVDLSGKGVYEGRQTKPLTRRRVTQFDYLFDKIATACRKDGRESAARPAVPSFWRCGSLAKTFEFLFSFVSFPFSRASGRPASRSGADSTDSLQDSLRDFLRERCRGIHPRLLEAVADYSDSRKRGDVLDWLENGVREDGVREEWVRKEWVRKEGEEDARRILVSLGMLLELCGISMIVCFDQLDGMRGEELVTAFGDVVHFLVNDVKGMLPLAFIRLNTWSERFSRLDPAVTQRLAGNEMFLYACTLEQARELIRVRLESRFKSDAEEKFQWLMERLEGKLKAGYSPRAVIELANREIVRSEKEPGADDPSGPLLPVDAEDNPTAVLAIFEAEYRKTLDRANAVPDKRPDAEGLVRALETWLISRADFEEVGRSTIKYISLTGRRAGGGLCAFIVKTEKNHKAISAALKKGTSFLQEHPDGECFYVTDGRCDFGTPERRPELYEELKKFRGARGVTLFLNREQAAAWYALSALRLKVDNGSVSLPASGGGERAAQVEDLSLFLRQIFKENLLEWAEKAPSAS